MSERDKKQLKNEQQEEVAAAEAEDRQEHVVRHTISAEETFTLAKDVFDLRCFFKNIYANRAVIARRLNIFSLICSLIFTMFYTAYAVYAVINDWIELFGLGIAIFCMLGVYAVFAVLLILATLLAGKVTTKTVKKYNKALKIFRFCIRIISIAMAIIAIAISAGSAGSAAIALKAVLIIISIILIIIQAIPLLFGGFANLARWAISPAKGRARFSAVVMEWYGLVRSGSGEHRSTSKISPKYIDEINSCIDIYLIPLLGKERITNIDASDIYSVTEAVPESLREIAEGIFKSVFEYAEECGYVIHNPTKSMELGGSLEERQKPVRTLKSRLMKIGKKLGKSIVRSYLENDEDV